MLLCLIDLWPLGGAEGPGVLASRGKQVSIAGHILNEVHEGGAGVGACPDVDDITGASQLKPGLRLLSQREIMNRTGHDGISISKPPLA